MRASGSLGPAFWMGCFVLVMALGAGVVWLAGRGFVSDDAPVSVRVDPPDHSGSPRQEATTDPLPRDKPVRAAASDADGTAEMDDGDKVAEAGMSAPPRLDEVRYEADGLVVIAGRVAPFADVVLRLDGVDVARASADGTGAFATVASLEPSELARVLTLAQVDASGGEILSTDELILAPVRRPAPADPAIAMDDAGRPTETPATEMAAVGSTAGPKSAGDAEGERPTAGETDLDPHSPDSAEDQSVSPANETNSRTAALSSEPEGAGPSDDPDAGSTETALRDADEPAQVATLHAAATEPDGKAKAAERGAAEDVNADSATESASGDPVTGPSREAEQISAASDQELAAAELAPGSEAAQTPAVAPTVRPGAPNSLKPITPAEPDALAKSTPLAASVGSISPPQADRAQPSAPDADTGPRIAILRSNAEGVRVLRPADTQTQPMRQVALDSISYSAAGAVELQGRAQEVARQVRVYLDNRPVASLDVSSTGNWRGSLPEIDTGVYTLRIDEVDATGRVTSRVETPFKREPAELLAAATQNAAAKVSAVTVQKGDTLWAISRDRYGEGILYVRVFEANRASIRDPDLIYPGQIFTLPD